MSSSEVFKVESLDQLKKRAFNTGFECFIRLNHGLRSSKLVSWDSASGEWHILNWIDDTEQDLKSDEELAAETLIVEAIENGALWAWRS